MGKDGDGFLENGSLLMVKACFHQENGSAIAQPRNSLVL